LEFVQNIALKAALAVHNVDLYQAEQLSRQTAETLGTAAMAQTLLDTLRDRPAWRRLAKNGIEGVTRHYSWQAHVEKYLQVIRPLVERSEKVEPITGIRRAGMFRDNAIFTSIDLNLIGDDEALREFLQLMQVHRRTTIFGIATGRRLDDALARLREYNIPKPDVLITGQGTEIHYAPALTRSESWVRHINHRWNPQEVRDVLAEVPGLTLQPKMHQDPFKISYYVDHALANAHEVRQTLLRNEQTVNAVFSFGQFLDVVPVRASKGLAMRWCAEQLGFALENTLVCGATAADTDMLMGNTLGAVVSNRHLDELADVAAIDSIFQTQRQHAAGVLEAIAHYDFFAKGRSGA
jgi:sucrose-phosphate synthase